MALSWSTKRQLSIIGILILFFGTIAGLVLYPKFNKQPTCFDTKKNGTETGVDCGGSCQLICPFEVSGIVVKWTRSFAVTDSVYNAVAYIENQNSSAAISRISYEFRLYDEERKFIAVRTGETFIGADGPTAIFEGGIETGSRGVAFTTFKFLESPVWLQVPEEAKDVVVTGHDGLVSELNGKPRLSGTVSNTSAVYGIASISVVGIVYDDTDNAVGVSQTVVEALPPKGDASVYFTWPNQFGSEPVRNEIIPRWNPFLLK